MPTLNRVADVQRFMEALDAQSFRDLELIVIDQNPDDSLRPVLAPYLNKFPITHVQTHKPIGAVAARNMGAQMMKGEVLAFPDDDCFYEPDFLQRVDEELKTHPDWDGLSGGVVGLEHYYSKKPAFISRYKVWWQGLEFTLFYRKSIIDKIGLMDPTFGPGAKTPWGAGEAADYMLRTIEAGFKVHYDPTLKVHHPGPLTSPRNDADEAKCVYGYSMGKGHVLHKHHLPFWYMLYLAARPMARALGNAFIWRWSKAAISLAVTKGVLTGYFLSIRLAEAASDATVLAQSV